MLQFNLTFLLQHFSFADMNKSLPDHITITEISFVLIPDFKSKLVW